MAERNIFCLSIEKCTLHMRDEISPNSAEYFQPITAVLSSSNLDLHEVDPVLGSLRQEMHASCESAPKSRLVTNIRLIIHFEV
jgi:hypothetical protein